MKPLTDFQMRCESKLKDALIERNLPLVNRRTAGKKEAYIVAEMPEVDLRLWIYEDEAMFTVGDKSYVYEAPDYPSQDMLIIAFVAAVIACTKSEVPTDTGSARISLFKGKKL